MPKPARHPTSRRDTTAAALARDKTLTASAQPIPSPPGRRTLPDGERAGAERSEGCPGTARQADPLGRYLHTLFGREDPSALVAVRFRRPGGVMRQRFYPIERLVQLADTLRWLARQNDVYVALAPRVRRAGGRAAVKRVWALWADCDSETAARQLRSVRPAPTLTIASGSPEHGHAYWALERPVGGDEAERLNRRLAYALGGDAGAVTGAAAILRPPSTLNHKHRPPRRVWLERLSGELHQAVDVAGDLPDPPGSRCVTDGRPAVRDRGGDPLLELEPAAYVEALTGLRPGHAGKVSCPFHEDAVPSLHVYPTAAEGWFCFGCGRGGSVYDLAGELWGRATQGRDFLALREDLDELLEVAR